jgi:hypothetical protein
VRVSGSASAGAGCGAISGVVGELRSITAAA